ncbi:hypothetical protein K2173_011176 [Erythroxylum novogranatense]|uniref:Light-harvesting complex-like protein OHP2, chloroplastic n=1 Tax=Erythroxylum novogranatense TaxID=1862640 RepID=A0AAV8TVJ2_9ROSI|nr:hypothetical protein K2173_011176 [Erythroxylum novogranatense]
MEVTNIPMLRSVGLGETKEMALASSLPCIKIPNPPLSFPCSSSSPPSTSCFRLPTNTASIKAYAAVTVRSSQAEGPIRRPVAPPLREQPSPPSKPIPPPSPPSSPAPPPPRPVTIGDKNAITLEFQRKKAKELQDYFNQKKLEEANQGPFFGFLGKNEIINGRWAMFGFAVGMLTEYATGSNFVDQVKILLSNFGIIDLE